MLLRPSDVLTVTWAVVTTGVALFAYRSRLVTLQLLLQTVNKLYWTAEAGLPIGDILDNRLDRDVSSIKQRVSVTHDVTVYVSLACLTQSP